MSAAFNKVNHARHSGNFCLLCFFLLPQCSRSRDFFWPTLVVSLRPYTFVVYSAACVGHFFCYVWWGIPDRRRENEFPETLHPHLFDFSHTAHFPFCWIAVQDIKHHRKTTLSELVWPCSFKCCFWKQMLFEFLSFSVSYFSSSLKMFIMCLWWAF